MDARILITGAGGFVGPWLLRQLKKGPLAEAAVLCWSKKAVSELTEVVDVQNRSDVERSVRNFRPTHVAHLAAQSHVPTSFADPEHTWRVNVMGTLHLFEAIRRYAPDARILFVGSSEVYGRSFQQRLPVAEDALLAPMNPYAASKAAADLMAGQYAVSGLKITRVRPFNHIGPGQSEDFVASAFAAQIARIEAGLQPPILRVGNLNAQRDFLDVMDVVRGYALILEGGAPIPVGTVLNVCSGSTRTIQSLLEQLLSLASVQISVELDPGRMRPTEIPVAAGSSALATHLLGWTPRIPFEQTLLGVLDYWRGKIG